MKEGEVVELIPDYTEYLGNLKMMITNGFNNKQAKRFVEHLSECHSWYKHLPLIGGGEFIIFLDKDAGINYPTEHPRLPFGNTKDKYQEAFGYLNYYWRIGDEKFWTDGSGIDYQGKTREELDKELEKYVFIKLYPYVCWFDEAIGYSIHKEDCEKIRSGYQHEMRNELISLMDVTDSLNNIWCSMNYEEQDSLCENNINEDNPKILKYRKIEKSQIRLCKILRQQEINKISNAVFNLK